MHLLHVPCVLLKCWDAYFAIPTRFVFNVREDTIWILELFNVKGVQWKVARFAYRQTHLLASPVTPNTIMMLGVVIFVGIQ